VKPPKLASLASPSTQAWWRNPGIIYFVAAGNPPVSIKIGMAAQTGKNSLRAIVVRRLSQIQSSNHELIELLGIIHFTQGDHPTRDADAMERELHLEFKHLQRFKSYMRGSEWFTPSAELLARIEELSVKPETLGLPNTFSMLLSSGRQT
jgi:hypothetical protein